MKGGVTEFRYPNEKRLQRLYTEDRHKPQLTGNRARQLLQVGEA